PEGGRVAATLRAALRTRPAYAGLVRFLGRKMSSTQVLVGFHAVASRLRHAPDSIKEIYIDASRKDGRMQQLIERAQEAGCKVHPVDVGRLDGMARGQRHQGVAAMAANVPLAMDLDEVLDDVETPAFVLL